jgi:hypothetical protein
MNEKDEEYRKLEDEAASDYYNLCAINENYESTKLKHT